MTRSTTATVYIVYYSTYQHIHKLAKAIQRGADKVKGVDLQIFRVPETLDQEVLDKIGAPGQPIDVPIIDPERLPEADGLLFGIPTRFGMVPAQMKAFFDATGGLWASGALRGKQVGTFFSTNSQHGGQETTAFTMLPYFAHHGMQYVSFGAGHPALSQTKELVGGSPYGAGVLAGIEGDSPSKTELEIAETYGEYFAEQVLIRKLGEKRLHNKKSTRRSFKLF